MNFKALVKNISAFWIRYINGLSLDVVIGAILSARFVTLLLEVEPDWAFWLILPMSVWIIYTSDHLIDAFRLEAHAHTIRHLFHFSYRRNLLIFTGILAAINLFLIFNFLDPDIIRFGIITVAITGFYLFLVFLTGKNQSPRFQKELFVALIYTAGIWGGPAALCDYNLQSHQLLILSGFALLAYNNALILPWYEFTSDKLDGHHSFALLFGRKTTAWFLALFLMIVTIINVYCFLVFDFEYRYETGIIYLLMVFSLAGLIMFKRSLYKNYLYRILCELVFWMPGLILFF